MRGERQRGGRKLLPGLQGKQVGALLVGVGQRKRVTLGVYERLRIPVCVAIRIGVCLAISVNL